MMPKKKFRRARKKMSSGPEASRRAIDPGRLRGGSAEQEERLTNREREILGYFAEGLGTESIARRLSIARVTVRNHAQRILSKLGVHSRLAAVARAHREGLVESRSDSRSSPENRWDKLHE
jgi:DNA-binding NarL/FixJ family response regulator